MAETRCIFKRFEIKYLVTDSQRAVFEAALNEYMTPDEYGNSTICNIYYDTPDYRLIRHSLEKPAYKEKLRLRSYGQTDSQGEVFLELKKKYDGVVYKRRIALPDYDAEQSLMYGLPLTPNTQIAKEIDYFRQVYGELVPAMYICYDREAYFSKTDPNLRISFDRGIRWRKNDLTLTSAPSGEQLLQEGCSLMEIKIASSMPLWLTHLLCENSLFKTNFSKYGSAYTTLISRGSERSVFCA